MDTYLYKGGCWKISRIIIAPLYSMNSWEYLYRRDTYSGFRIIKLS